VTCRVPARNPACHLFPCPYSRCQVTYSRCQVFHVVVPNLVNAKLGEYLMMPVADREILLRVINRLYDQLENHADRYRHRRDPEVETLFDYPIWIFDGENWRTLRFSVDDCQAPGYLFVVAVSHRLGKT
jgi:hypothetical protein